MENKKKRVSILIPLHLRDKMYTYGTSLTKMVNILLEGINIDDIDRMNEEDKMEHSAYVIHDNNVEKYEKLKYKSRRIKKLLADKLAFVE